MYCPDEDSPEAYRMHGIIVAFPPAFHRYTVHELFRYPKKAIGLKE